MIEIIWPKHQLAWVATIEAVSCCPPDTDHRALHQRPVVWHAQLVEVGIVHCSFIQCTLLVDHHVHHCSFFWGALSISILCALSSGVSCW